MTMTIEMVKNDYAEFIASKTAIDNDHGIDIELSDIHESLFDWQKAIVKWAVKKGRAALFEDCGLGKTRQQLEWMRLILNRTGGKGLIVCPLSVAEQTQKEAEDIDIEIEYLITENDYTGITNYERLNHFDGGEYQAVVLDESSILKSIGGKTKNTILSIFDKVHYKLSCTATPSPNDISELGNQVEFLNVCTRSEMLSKYFINDNGDYRLKGHAKHRFYQWMATWAVFIRKPSDIGFSDDGYKLPKLNIEAVYVDSDYIPEGELYPTTDIKGIQGRHAVRKQTAEDKIKRCAEDVNNSKDQWLIFCGLNTEADGAEKAIQNSVNIKGAHTPEHKNAMFWKFKKKELQNLITKGKIGGFGMNFQNAHNMGFIGLNDSYELYYQCIRRELRYGQESDTVNIKIYLTNAEQMIYQNVLKKEKQTNDLFNEVVKEMQDFTKQEIQTGKIEIKDKYETDIKHGENWTAYKGDVIETIKKIETESIHMQCFSPPFFNLFTYSPSPRDMGNNADDVEFWKHLNYLIPELYRVLMPGRICAVHCMDVPATLVKDGYIGLKNLRGGIIDRFAENGFVYDGCAFIPKNPQAQSIRTHAKGLTFSQFEKDSSWSRPALPDYLIKFRKPGENITPVQNGNGHEVSRDGWIGLAAGIWRVNPEAEIKQAEFEELQSGIWESVRETYTLNTRKYPGDEAHLCPLQLDTIHNAIRLWSNPGETIQDPFAGIGSTGVQGIEDNRKAVLHELKPEYFDQLCKNMEIAVTNTKKGLLDFGN